MTPTLYNWSVREDGGLYGQLQNSRHHPDGHWVCVKGILAVDHEGNLIDLNRNRLILGDPDPVYADIYPNVRQRLLAQINETALHMDELVKEPGT